MKHGKLYMLKLVGSSSSRKPHVLDQMKVSRVHMVHQAPFVYLQPELLESEHNVLCQVARVQGIDDWLVSRWVNSDVFDGKVDLGKIFHQPPRKNVAGRVSRIGPQGRPV